MLLPTTTPSTWTSGDAQRLSEFLESPAGRRAIELVADQAPVLLDGSDVNKTLVASGAVKGYGDALRNLFGLTTVQPPQPQIHDAYPDLDNEKAWKGADPL